MQWRAERTAVAAVFATVSAVALEYIFAAGGDHVQPTPSNNLASPVRYLEWRMGKAEGEQSDMGGGQFVEGEVEVVLYIEKLAGEDGLVTLADSVWTAFDAASVDGFEYRTMHRDSEDLSTEGFLGRRYAIAYWRSSEPS